MAWRRYVDRLKKKIEKKKIKRRKKSLLYTRGEG
jgi:hypothetical protein